MEENIALLFLIASLSRVGMILIHISVIPSKNVNLIVFHHILNISFSTTLFLCFGYKLCTLKNILDLSSGWIISHNSYFNRIFNNWRYVLLSEGLISTTIAGRAHTACDLVLIGLTSMLVQPIIINMITDGAILNNLVHHILNTESINSDLILLHIFPGGIALVTTLLFGQRVLNIKDIDINSIPINSQSFSVLGYMFITLGYVLSPKHIMRALFAVPTGIFVMSLNFIIKSKDIDYWICIWVLQSGLAAAVGTAGCTRPYLAMYAAAFIVMIFAVSKKLVRMGGIEDQCNIIAVHGISGLLGIIIAELSNENIRLKQVANQITVALFVFSIGILTALLCLLPFKLLGFLKGSDEMENQKESQKLSKAKIIFKKRNMQPGSHSYLKMKKVTDINYPKLESKPNNNLDA